MKKTILIPGLIGGFIVAIVMVSATLYGYNSGRFESSMLLGYASMILAFSLIFVAIKNLRDKHYNGTISFGKAFKAGLLVTLVTSTVYVIAWLFCYYFFIPDFMEQYTNYRLQKLTSEGASTAEIAKQTAQMQEYIEMYDNPLVVILLTYAEIFWVGLLVSLIAALLLKKKTTAPAAGILYGKGVNLFVVNRESSIVNSKSIVCH